jgi:hypothetical protein
MNLLISRFVRLESLASGWSRRHPNLCQFFSLKKMLLPAIRPGVRGAGVRIWLLDLMVC